MRRADYCGQVQDALDELHDRPVGYSRALEAARRKEEGAAAAFAAAFVVLATTVAGLLGVIVQILSCTPR